MALSTEITKTLELFSQMMIEKIETISTDWQKPWFTENTLQWPRNLAGREYNGMNAMMLLMHCEKEGYPVARFCTFAALQRLNAPGQPLASVLKGAKSFPVLLTTFTCVEKETEVTIKYEEYKELSSEEKDNYNVYPKTHVFRVFNISQTNLAVSRPDLWEKLTQEIRPFRQPNDEFSLEVVDEMIGQDKWICPVQVRHQDEAYYSVSKNEIVVPEKQQFRCGESFYGTLFHEMTHSTGADGVLGRLKPAVFGSHDYAREQLVAELGSALMAYKYGFLNTIKEESCAYLKGWIKSLQQSPEYIKTVLTDVRKAVTLINHQLEQATE